jgi:hypothetical protein
LRYDTLEELTLIRDRYRNELRLYKNLFQPVMMLVRKDRVFGRPKRVYSVPKTPYHCLPESGQLSAEHVRELSELYLSLNPAELKRQIDRKLARLYALYQKKKKRPISVDPYKKQRPSMVTFLLSKQPRAWVTRLNELTLIQTRTPPALVYDPDAPSFRPLHDFADCFPDLRVFVLIAPDGMREQSAT